jgi:hypothetical protein
VYLLHKGYEEFFKENSKFCTPESYQKMNDERFLDEMRKCRAKAKSWTGDVRASAIRLPKSRSRLVMM